MLESSLKNGQLKYQTLVKVVKACLALPHGKADVERSYSLNKNTVTDDCNRLDEHSLNAIRIVKESTKIAHGSASDVVRNKGILRRTQAANAMYKAYEQEQKH